MLPLMCPSTGCSSNRAVLPCRPVTVIVSLSVWPFRDGKMVSEVKDVSQFYQAASGTRIESANPGSINQQLLQECKEPLVAFLLGCSFGFEDALVAAGLSIRHQEETVWRVLVKMTLCNVKCLSHVSSPTDGQRRSKNCTDV